MTPAGRIALLFSGPTACAVSPADGQPAAEANWPRPNYYDTYYHSGLSHTDGHIYLAGYRNTNAGSCDGRADVMIKRFSFDAASGARGVVEHVAGAREAPAAAEAPATGEPAQTFRFRGSVQLMRENLTVGAGGAIFIYQGRRIRMITRVDAGNLSSWTIRDVTKSLSGVQDFIIDANVGADGRSGAIYFVDGGSQIYRYALGSGAADDLDDDDVIGISWSGMDDLNIVKLARLSSGEFVFGDGKAGGQVYGYKP